MTIGTIADVARYLRTEGYCAPGKDQTVKKSKVYNDHKAGVLTFANGKAITQTEVEAYITKAMLIKRAGAGRRGDEIEDLSVLRANRELEKINIEIKIKELNYQKEMGLLIPKKEVYLQSAMKIAAFESGIKHLLRIRAVDCIAATGGDLKKANLICDLLYPDIDDLLDEMGRMDEIKITVKRRKGDDHENDRCNETV